jgi:hypothetical protein
LVDVKRQSLWQSLDEQIQGMAPEIEAQIASALAAATLKEELAVGDAVLSVDVYPTDVEVTPDGARVTAAGSFSADPHPCVSGGATESLATPSDLPEIAEGGSGYDVAGLVADDFINQAFFALYSGGVLCQTLSGDDIDTTLLSLISGETYSELFPESRPMILGIHPTAPPVASVSGGHALDVEVPGLALDMIAELDGRNARIVGFSLDATAGADMSFDGTSGVLAVQPEISELAASVAVNEFAPGEDDALAAAFGQLFDSLAGPILGNVLSGLSFPLPAMDGLGLTALVTAPAGPDDDFLGVYATAGEVAYTNAGGCSGDGGCGGGCSGSGALPTGMLVTGLASFLSRRRMDDAGGANRPRR